MDFRANFCRKDVCLSYYVLKIKPVKIRTNCKFDGLFFEIFCKKLIPCAVLPNPAQYHHTDYSHSLCIP